MNQQCSVRDTPEKEPKHFWQSPGSSVQSRTDCPSSSLCPQLLQRWPWHSSLSFSHQELLKGMEGALAVHSSSSHSQQEMVCGVREAHTKKKNVYIFINAKNKYLRQNPQPL